MVLKPGAQLQKQFRYIAGSPICVLPVVFFINLYLFIHPVPDTGLIITEAGYIAPDLDLRNLAYICLQQFPCIIPANSHCQCSVIRQFRSNAALQPRYRNHRVIFIFRELAIYTDTNHIAVLAVFTLHGCDILFVGTLAVLGVHCMALIERTVCRMAVIECPGSLCRVTHKQEFIVLSGQSTGDGFHDRICDTGSLVHDKQHIVLMETLHILRLRSGPGYRKPPLFIADHINIGLRPFKEHGEQWRVVHPLIDLGPQYIMQLLLCWSRCNDSRIWETYYKPQKQ